MKTAELPLYVFLCQLEFNMMNYSKKMTFLFNGKILEFYGLSV